MTKDEILFSLRRIMRSMEIRGSFGHPVHEDDESKRRRVENVGALLEAILIVESYDRTKMEG